MLGYCFVGVLPIKKEANSSSEQVSQMVFGETATVIEEIANSTWIKIITNYDSYQGYVDKRNLIFVSENYYQEIIKQNADLFSWNCISFVNIKKGDKITSFPIPKASRIINTNYKINDYCFSVQDAELVKTYPFNKEIFTKIAFSYLNCPYQWGGKSNWGIDCSGFTQQVFAFFNKKLLRDASLQSKQGIEVKNISVAKLSDLCFFDNEKGNVNHVGILLDNNYIIHSSGRVRVDKIDEKGIIDSDTNKYSHHLNSIRRFF
jgi:cell wall-associated NlpC family hydrolase